MSFLFNSTFLVKVTSIFAFISLKIKGSSLCCPENITLFQSVLLSPLKGSHKGDLSM